MELFFTLLTVLSFCVKISIMPFAPGVETVIVAGKYQDAAGEPARGYVELQLKQPTADSDAEVIFTTKKLRYELDGNGEFEGELIKTGDAINLTRDVELIVHEVFDGVRNRKWQTIINDAGIETGKFNLASASETTSAPLNQYVLLGTYSSGMAAKASTAYVDAQIATRAPVNSPAFTGTPTGITKTHVGLGNVDNTSDAAKPISTATQTALNGKRPLGSNFTSTGRTLGLSDAYGVIVATATGSGGAMVIPTNAIAAFDIGTQITIINGNSGGNIIVAPQTPGTTTVYKQGSNTPLTIASGATVATLAIRGTAILTKTATDVWYIGGNVS